jgi:cystathionine gamma-synthase
LRITQVHDLCTRRFADLKQACLLFPAAEYASACKSYLCQPPQGDSGLDEETVHVKPLNFDIKSIFGEEEDRVNTTLTLYAVFLPKKDSKLAMIFWRLTGSGISSRMAEDLWKDMRTVREADVKSEHYLSWPRNSVSFKAEKIIRERVASYLERGSIGGPRTLTVAGDDVFLYPTGMSAIYNLTRALRDWPGEKTVVFGFPYELTLKTQQDFAKGCSFFGLGTVEEMELLEDYLHMLAQQETTIQAVWCECASNPLLRTVDLERMRRLADRYGFLVIVDDTIGSSANVDVLGVADIVVTSLTKSFSGLADVMAGSVALNPASL